jgi:predicted extracellular nuclease
MAQLGRVVGSCVLFLCGAALAAEGQTTHPVVISQIYGGGGNSGATLRNDYIELFNRGDAPVDISGWSIQYASSAGSSWQKTDLAGVIQPGHYYLIQQAAGAGGTTPLPTPDATGAGSGIPMSATSGKVALVRSATALTCGAVTTPCLPNANIEDFVGYGSAATQFEGSGPTSTLSNGTAALRAGNGCVDADNNAADFGTGAPAPRNSAVAGVTCDGGPGPEPTCTPTQTIAAVQGTGQVSPLVSTTVSVAGIVTGRVTTGSARGFFVQMPDGADGDPASSDGVFVFTGSASPSALAAVGNDVCVTGTVSEFIPSSDPGTLPLTEIVQPSVITVTATARPLPTPVTLTAADTPANTFAALERFEGMRVKVERLTVVGPTLGSVDEPSAAGITNGVFYGVVEGVARPFREPGADLQDVLPAGAPANVPRFDGNPERLRVDSDALGAAPLDVTSGATVSNLVGPLTWAFRTYSLFPDPAETATVTGLASATPVPAPAASQFTIGGFNLERFFDTQDDPGVSDVALTTAALERRLKKTSLAIRTVMRAPDIIGVEEAENLSVLQTLAARLNSDTVAGGDADPGYEAFLVEGNDIGGIDVGFLVKTTRVTVVDVTQEGKDTTYIDPNSGQPALLNDRPPLILRASVALPSGAAPVTVIANHLRSLTSLTDPVDGPRIRAKRAAQAEFLANLVQARQTADPQERLVLLGDFNAYQFNDGYVDVLGTIAGQPAPADQVVQASPDLVNPDLLDTMGLLPAAQRYSYVFDGHAQIIDHLLINQAAAALFQQIAVARNDADFPETFRNDETRPERVSDHDMPVAYFGLPAVNVSARVAVFSSGLVYNRVTRTYNGTIQITNTSAQAIDGPIHVVLDQLTPGVTLANAAGQFQGLPYLTIGTAPLAPGQSATVAVQFTNPGGARIGYAARTYSGDF